MRAGDRTSERLLKQEGSESKACRESTGGEGVVGGVLGRAMEEQGCKRL